MNRPLPAMAMRPLCLLAGAVFAHAASAAEHVVGQKSKSVTFDLECAIHPRMKMVINVRR